MTLWASPADGPSTSVGPGTRLGGRYELQRPLASGGMAQVWVGLDTVLDRQVAVKILHPHLATDTSFVARFRREAVASARLSHPSIVAVFDTVSGNGVEAMVMELIEGRTLRALLDDVGALPIDEVLHVGISIASALDEAHRAGIVHRDIKPANIMVATDHRVLVTDFGIAKAGSDADLTVTGTLLGTAKYLSPEQVTGGNIDPRSDLYSLGVLLFEALTGNVPFKADTDAATALARLHQDPPALRTLRPNVPPELEAIVAKLMARNANDRFPRASAVQEALVRMRANLPSSSRPFTGPTPVVPPSGWPAPPSPSFHPPTAEGPSVPVPPSPSFDPPSAEGRAVPPTPPPNPPRPGAPITPTPPLPGAPVGPVPPLSGAAFDADRLRPPDPPAGTVAGPPLDPALIAVTSAPTPDLLGRPDAPGPIGDIHEAGTVRADRATPPDPPPNSAHPDMHEAGTVRADRTTPQPTAPDTHDGPTIRVEPGSAIPDMHEAGTVRADRTGTDPDAAPTVRVDPDPPHRPTTGETPAAAPPADGGQATVRIPPPTTDPSLPASGPPSPLGGPAALGTPSPLSGPVPPARPAGRSTSGPLLLPPDPPASPRPSSGPLVPPADPPVARAISGPLLAPPDPPTSRATSGPLAVTPGPAAPGMERVRRSSRSRLLSLVAVAAIMALIVVIVASGAGPFGNADDDTSGGDNGGDPAAPLAVASAVSFDPQTRDPEKQEREDLVPLAFDGDRNTAWVTETYRREDFGGLKDGVGLLLSLDEATTVSAVDLTTNTVGYTVEIYVGDTFGPDPTAWGPPAAQVGDGPPEVSLDLTDARGSVVLVWVRDTGRTGEKFRFELAEVTLR